MDHLVQREGCQVYLIPHVFSDDNSHCLYVENDLIVMKELHEKYPETIVIKDCKSSHELKSIISQMDIFIGARMHATIASVSCGVATIPYKYSKKFDLYKSLGYPYVIDGQNLLTKDAVNETIMYIENKEELVSSGFGLLILKI